MVLENKREIYGDPRQISILFVCQFRAVLPERVEYFQPPSAPILLGCRILEPVDKEVKRVFSVEPRLMFDGGGAEFEFFVEFRLVDGVPEGLSTFAVVLSFVGGGIRRLFGAVDIPEPSIFPAPCGASAELSAIC